MVNELFDLKGKTALITGSTRGIGKALAEGMIAAGCTVWMHGRNEGDAKKVADELGAFYVAADFESHDAIDTIYSAILKKSNRLDILVNNAGIEVINPFNDFDIDIFDKTLNINTRSPIALTHKLLPLLKRANGASIINITSIHQEVAYPHNLSYSVSKAALAMATKVLALELASFNIRVNNFAPGAVRTEINAEIIDSMNKEFREWIPLGRVASTTEMIGTVLYLASNASAYMTGETIFVDGGYKNNVVRYRP